MDELTDYDFNTVHVPDSGYDGYEMDSEIAFTKQNFHTLIEFVNRLVVTVNELEGDIDRIKQEQERT